MVATFNFFAKVVTCGSQSLDFEFADESSTLEAIMAVVLIVEQLRGIGHENFLKLYFLLVLKLSFFNF